MVGWQQDGNAASTLQGMKRQEKGKKKEKMKLKCDGY